jgi:hypothetical protein
MEPGGQEQDQEMLRVQVSGPWGHSQQDSHFLGWTTIDAVVRPRDAGVWHGPALGSSHILQGSGAPFLGGSIVPQSQTWWAN